jgi:hypothetical protein
MAEKQLGIQATASVDSAINDLQNLIDKLTEIPDTVSSSVDVLINDLGIDTLQDDLTLIDNTTISPEVDGTSLVDLSTNASIASSELMDASNSASDLGTSISTLDSTAINEAASAASALGDNLSSAAGSASATSTEVASASSNFGDLSGVVGSFAGATGTASGEVSGLTGMMDELLGVSAALGPEIMAVVAAIGALVIAAVEAVPAAGEFADSWSRLGEAVGMGGASMEEVSADWASSIDIMKEETGRSAGLIREHIIQMGLAGITAKDLVIDAFSGIAGAAYVTGQSVDSIEAAYKRMVSTGVLARRQLIALGITDNDVLKATGMTMDQVSEKFKNLDANGRAALLNQILLAKYGESANTAYKNSWQHVGDAIGAAWKGLEIAVGSFILPIAIPTINALTFVINSLAWALNSIRGYFDSLNISIGTVLKTIGALSLVIPGIGPLLGLIYLALGYVIDNWNFLTESMGRFFALIQQGNWAGAIQVLIAVFYDAFTEIGTFIFNFFIYTLPALIGQASGTLLDIGIQVLQWIITGLISISGWLADTLLNMFVGAGTQAGAGGGQGAVNGFAQWLHDNSPKIAQIISDVLFKVLPELVKIAALVTGIVLKAVWDEFARWAGNLPGDMYNWGKNAFDSFTDAIIDSIPGLRWALDEVKKLFPHSPPKEGPLSEITAANMGKWVSSIMDAGMDAAGSFNLNNVINPVPNLSGATLPGSGSFNSSQSIEINVSLEGAVINSELDAQKVGTAVGTAAGDSLASKLKQQATNRGFSTINSRR